MNTPSLKEFILKKRIWELEHEGMRVSIFNSFGSLSLDKYLEIMGKNRDTIRKRKGGINALSHELAPVQRQRMSSIAGSKLFKQRKSVLMVDKDDAENIWDAAQATQQVASFNEKVMDASDKTSSIDLKQLYRDIGPNKSARQVLRTLRVHQKRAYIFNMAMRNSVIECDNILPQGIMGRFRA